MFRDNRAELQEALRIYNNSVYKGLDGYVD